MIQSITRQFNEDQTIAHLWGWKIILTARPIKHWKYAYWGMWPRPGIRWQCPWITFVMVREAS